MARTYHVHKVAISDEIYSALEKKRRVEKPHLKMTQYVQDVLFRFGKGQIVEGQGLFGGKGGVVRRGNVSSSQAPQSGYQEPHQKAG